MKCPFCSKDMSNDSVFSQHMNIVHRGKPYKGLYQANHIINKLKRTGKENIGKETIRDKMEK